MYCQRTIIHTVSEIYCNTVISLFLSWEALRLRKRCVFKNDTESDNLTLKADIALLLQFSNLHCLVYQLLTVKSTIHVTSIKVQLQTKGNLLA